MIYNSYTEYLKHKFKGRVQKISINAGRTCPNRDGTLGHSGCSYCLNTAFTPSYCHPDKSVKNQIEEGIEFHKRRYRRAVAYLAYFQSYSNTYADVAELEHSFDEAIQTGLIAGFSVGTRPDCISDDICRLLKKYSQDYYIRVELGIESVYDKTLDRIKRMHSYCDTVNAVKLLSSYNIETGGHYIIGLPGEDRSEILDSAGILNSLGIHSLKFHQLQILRNTLFASEYQTNPENFALFELAEYVDFIITYCEFLSPDIYIERFAGEVPPRYLLAPDWGIIRYDELLRKIVARFEERKTFQGRKFLIR